MIPIKTFNVQRRKYRPDNFEPVLKENPIFRLFVLLIYKKSLT